MSTYLIKTTEVYRCDSESEANSFVKEQKNSEDYEVTKSTIENRQIKKQGEIIDEWKRVTITKVFCEEKEPFGDWMPSYGKNQEVNEKDED